MRSKIFRRVSDDTERVDCRITRLGYLKKVKHPFASGIGPQENCASIPSTSLKRGSCENNEADGVLRRACRSNRITPVGRMCQTVAQEKLNAEEPGHGFAFDVYGDSRSMMYLPYKADQKRKLANSWWTCLTSCFRRRSRKRW